MKNCIITGGNSGIGYQVAKQLAKKGYHVTLFCRNEKSAEHAVNEIIRETDNSFVDSVIVDLSVMEQVRKAAAAYLAKYSVVDVLINNAADFDISVKKPIFTEEGLEKQFATNVAAPFLLSELLLGALNKSEDGRVINISSQGLCVYPFLKLDFENLNAEKHYSPASTYYQNKLALLMISLYMREHHQNVKTQAVRVTNVKIDMRRYPNINPLLKAAYSLKSKFSIAPEKMAEIYTMLADENGKDGFLYDEKGREVRANKSAYDTESQEKLIQILRRYTNL